MVRTSIVEYQKNRPNFPREELEKYDGQWVAFNADGRRIVASGESLEDLFEHVEAAGENKHEIGIEKVVFGGMIVNIGAAEFE